MPRPLIFPTRKMAAFLSTTNTFLHPNLPFSPSSSSSSSPTLICPKRGGNGRKLLTLCKASESSQPSGQRLDKASSVLGQSTDADWVQKANAAFTKLSYGPQEKTEVDAFNSSIASLILSVSQNDVESSKTAFAASASSLEKWTTLTGLDGQLKGL